jgi:hypothetical protein
LPNNRRKKFKKNLTNDGNGFDAMFEEFEIKHIPDNKRVKWLENDG